MAATALPRATRPSKPGTSTPAADFNLAAVVRQHAESEPDPHKIAKSIAAALDADNLRAALELTLPDYIRKTRPYRTTGLRGGSGGIRSVRAPGSARWSAAAAIRGEVALLRASVFARGEWKFLGDCDHEDCADLASSRDQRAADVQAEADRYRALSKALRKHKAASVRDLPADVVEGIFNA